MLKMFLAAVVVSASPVHAQALYTDVCGSSRLRLHARHELKSIEVMDGAYPQADLEIDLSGDGLDEYLRAHQCGNSGCDYVIYFQEQKGQYRCLGEVWMHRKGFARLLIRHNDFYDLLTYSHLSAEEGSLELQQFDGRKYQVVHAVKGKASELFPLVEKRQ